MYHERIRRFLADRFLFDEHAAIDHDQSLIASGVLDSTAAMELVLFLETEFHLQVEPHELVPDNLDSISRIAEFVNSKSSTRAPVAVPAEQTSAVSAAPSAKEHNVSPR